MRPTLWPSFTSASARLTATVVLPTPPLPLATATRFFTPGMAWRSGCGIGAGGIRVLFLRSNATLKSRRERTAQECWGSRDDRLTSPVTGAEAIIRWRRGIFCISCRSRRGRDRFGRSWRLRGPALALRLALALFGTAALFAGALACAPFRVRRLVSAAGEVRWRGLRRWRPRRPHEGALVAAAVELAPAHPEAARSAGSECGTDSGWFRCRCAPSCLRKEQMLLF